MTIREMCVGSDDAKLRVSDVLCALLKKVTGCTTSESPFGFRELMVRCYLSVSLYLYLSLSPNLPISITRSTVRVVGFVF